MCYDEVIEWLATLPNPLASRDTAIVSDEWQQPYEPLTDRELEVLRMVATGLSNQEIANQLFLTLDTVKWHNKQTFQKLRVRNRAQAIARARELDLLEPTAVPLLSPRNKHNLPIQTTLFIGREEELTEIRRLLLDEPGCRLLTLVGPGGMGKTRLALAAAAQFMNAFPDGVYFVPLAVVGDAAFIVHAIAEALNYKFYGKTDPAEQLLNYLQSQKLLLVMDNFEHLRDGTDLLADILKRAPEVKLLATSRERLQLQEEWSYEVEGLSYPAVKTNETAGKPNETADLLSLEFENYQAVQLFLQRARQIDANFAADGNNLMDIIRICQLVEGMPLGLELAAPWIRSLSSHEIALEIERSLDFLTTTLRNLPERHRSLRVVIERSWQRLSSAEQLILCQLSVFRGGCTRQAAERVTGATLADLTSLIDKALLRRTNTGRYELHELIRQFGEAQLQSDPAAMEQVQQRHRDYFIAFLEARTSGVKGGRQKETLAEIKADIDNVRMAWRQALANRDVEALERAAECLFVFYLYSSGHYEGQTVFQQAAASFIEGSNTATDELVVLDKQENLAGFLLAGQGYFLARIRDPYMGQTLLEQALALVHRAETRDRRKEGFVLLWLGWMFLLQGRAEKVQDYVEPALAVLSETGDRWAEGWCLLLWANALSEAHPIEAEAVYKRGQAVCRESGDLTNVGYISQMWSGVNMSLGRYAQAKQHIDEAARAFEEMGNVLGLGYTLQRRGELAIFLGEYQQAIQAFQQAIVHFNEVRTEQNITATQISLGRVFQLQGDYDRAEQLYRQSFEASTARHNQSDIARCLLGLGCLAFDQGELSRAEQYHREALTLCQQQELELRVADVSRYLGHVLAASGESRHEEARHYFRQAFELATKHQAAPIVVDVCVGVAQLLAQASYLKQAIELVSFAEQHAASTAETQARARQTLAQIMKNMPSESPEFMQEPTGDLWAIVQEWLAENRPIKFEA